MPNPLDTAARWDMVDREVRAAYSFVVQNPTDECSMHRLLTLLDGDTEGMCSGPVMYEARLLGAADWSLKYHLCVACAAEFRREGKHEIRDIGGRVDAHA